MRHVGAIRRYSRLQCLPVYALHHCMQQGSRRAELCCRQPMAHHQQQQTLPSGHPRQPASCLRRCGSGLTTDLPSAGCRFALSMLHGPARFPAAN